MPRRQRGIEATRFSNRIRKVAAPHGSLPLSAPRRRRSPTSTSKRPTGLMNLPTELLVMICEEALPETVVHYLPIPNKRNPTPNPATSPLLVNKRLNQECRVIWQRRAILDLRLGWNCYSCGLHGRECIGVHTRVHEPAKSIEGLRYSHMDLEELYRFGIYHVSFDISPSKKLLNSVWRDKIRNLWSLLYERAEEEQLWGLQITLYCRERDWDDPVLSNVLDNEWGDFKIGFDPLQIHVPHVEVHVVLYRSDSMPPPFGPVRPWYGLLGQPSFIRGGFDYYDASDDGEEKGDEE